jgi:hypothetical protein
MNPAFVEGTTPGLPTKAQCVEWYESVAGYSVNPRELLWAEAFGIYRGAIIMQGIKARHAQRQASSEKAMEYGKLMGPQAEMAWQFVREVKRRNEEASAQGKGYMLGKSTTTKERSGDEKAAEGKGYMISRPPKERSPDEKRAEGKGYMVSRPHRERSPDEKRAEGKGYMVSRPHKERSPDEKSAEGKGYMVGRPETS